MKEKFKYIGNIVLNKLKDKVFLVCVVVSTFLLIISKLNLVYNYTITLPVIITGAKVDYDQEIIDTDNKVYHINARFEGQGLDLLLLMLQDVVVISPDELVFEKIDDQKGIYQITIESMSKALSNRFSDVSLEAILNNRIILQTVTFTEKKVPLKSNIAVDTRGDYMQIGNTVFDPDSVTIYGVKAIVDTVEEVFTEYKYIRKISENMVGNIKIERNDNFEITPREASYAISIERYADLSQSYKIKLIGVKDYLKYSVFPENATLVFNVSQTAHKDFNPNDVEVYIEPIHKTNVSEDKLYTESNKYIIKYRNVPEGVEVLNTNPATVYVYRNVSK